MLTIVLRVKREKEDIKNAKIHLAVS